MNKVNEETDTSHSQIVIPKASSMKADRRPADTFHVIDFIREEMDERDWSIWRLIRNMAPGASDDELGRIKLSLDILALREPGVVLGVEGAQQVGRAFGTSAEFWLNLDDSWQDGQRTKSSEASNNPERGQHSPASLTESESASPLPQTVWNEAIAIVRDDGTNARVAFHCTGKTSNRYLVQFQHCDSLVEKLEAARDRSVLPTAEVDKAVTYIPPNVAHASCCRGSDVRHESISAISIAFEDGHACIDCCPCPDCGEYRAEQFERDPSGWDMVSLSERKSWRYLDTSKEVGESELRLLLQRMSELRLDAGYSGHHQNGFEMFRAKAEAVIKARIAASPDALPVESQDEVSKALAELRAMFPDSAYSIRADSFMSNGKRKEVILVEVRGGQFETPHSTYGQPSLSEAMAKVREYAGKAEQNDQG